MQERNTINKYYITPRELVSIILLGSKAIEKNLEPINSLNVFPVPDGDTGTNMFLTMKAIEEYIVDPNSMSDSEIVTAMARGALLGARGNSGVILAQFLQGFTSEIREGHLLDCKSIALAMESANRLAYKAVGNPVEGTLLTVIRHTAEAASNSASDNPDIISMWEDMTKAAKVSVSNTPELLPILKKAGVVDAGGQGFSILLEGALKVLKGESPEEIELPYTNTVSNQQDIDHAYQKYHPHEAFGYCTQFLLSSSNKDIDHIREKLMSMAHSTVVIGDEKTLRIHAHTTNPGALLTYGVSLGIMTEINIANMDDQHQEFVNSTTDTTIMKEIGVLAIASGQGLVDVFLQSGVSAVLQGTDTMNPSTQEILNAADGIQAENIIVLPNNPNIVAAAEQAATMSQKNVAIIPTKTIPQGIAATLAFNVDKTIDQNIYEMNQSTTSVMSAAVCLATRNLHLDNLQVEKDHVIGLIDGQLTVAGQEYAEVVPKLIALTYPEPDSLITIYWGHTTLEQEAHTIGTNIRGMFPKSDIEIVYGGQPHYNYIISVE